MKDATYKWLKLISDNKKIIAMAIAVFFGGGGLGYVGHGYFDANEKPSNHSVSHSQLEINDKPCICQCGITKHLKDDHQIDS